MQTPLVGELVSGSFRTADSFLVKIILPVGRSVLTEQIYIGINKSDSEIRIRMYIE
jgi:hypothetical protein